MARRLDAHSAQALAVLERHAGRREARRRLVAWRLFMISTAEIWGWRDGSEWLVSHYLLAPRGGTPHESRQNG
jgi:cyclopropane-fatty-acyl-phospholipid synthase